MIETVQQELKDLLGGRFDKLESPSLRLEKIMRYEKKANTAEEKFFSAESAVSDALRSAYDDQSVRVDFEFEHSDSPALWLSLHSGVGIERRDAALCNRK